MTDVEKTDKIVISDESFEMLRKFYGDAYPDPDAAVNRKERRALKAAWEKKRRPSK